ncbi:hypothetical protein IJH89_00370 [Candidatus Saccharibacteria bacterium]|nr:hypothetical protein [Candidatus Saccharibacteria bacterium]
MTESNSSETRYMDFVGRRRSSSTDPLISRPVAKKRGVVSAPSHSPSASRLSTSSAPIRPVSKPVLERSAPAKPSLIKSPASKPSPVRVSSSSEKAFVSRAPSTAPRELYPSSSKADALSAVRSSSSRSVKATKTTDRPVDSTAEKASRALSGSARVSGASSGKSPFLPSYNIDKRPLSSSVREKKDDNYEKLSFLGVSDASSERPRKNVYEKSKKSDLKSKAGEKSKKSEKSSPKKTVRIIDAPEEKTGLPLPVVMLITILLGAAVGAGVYFLLPK